MVSCNMFVTSRVPVSQNLIPKAGVFRPCHWLAAAADVRLTILLVLSSHSFTERVFEDAEDLVGLDQRWAVATKESSFGDLLVFNPPTCSI